MSWALHESRGSAGGNGGAAALRSCAAALAIQVDGVGCKREKWEVRACAHMLHKLKGRVRP